MICKIKRNKKYCRFNIVLKLNLKSPDNLGCSSVEDQLSGGVSKIISFYPFFKTLKIPFKFTFTLTLTFNFYSYIR